jgi:hypothetical protein
MTKLQEYVLAHAVRGACQCGHCIDASPNPEQHQPTGHTADLIFFKVSARKEADAETFKTLVRENKQGAFCEVDVLDGQEHNYIELGGWIGDQSLALMLMGLGTVLGVWKLLTPITLMGQNAPLDLVQQMAGAGFVIVQAPKN